MIINNVIVRIHKNQIGGGFAEVIEGDLKGEKIPFPKGKDYGDLVNDKETWFAMRQKSSGYKDIYFKELLGEYCSTCHQWLYIDSDDQKKGIKDEEIHDRDCPLSLA